MGSTDTVRRQDSHAMTELELAHSELKQTTGPEFYNRSSLSRRVGLMGVGFTTLFGVGCICVGAVVFQSSSTSYVFVPISIGRELFSLLLNLMVTACTEATGFAHGTALRSALASERRLHFNTNLRLLSAASGVFNPNGTLCNIMMAILLIVSYTSSLLAAIALGTTGTGVCPIPFLVLGTVLLLQAAIALASVRSTNILTWSSSPFDVTAALVHHAQILPQPGRCMYGVGDGKRQGPVKPCAKQSSTWGAHIGVRRVVLGLWLLVLICVAWGVIITASPFGYKGTGWTFIPQTGSSLVIYRIPLANGGYWILYFVIMAATQAPLTLGLHCSELIINLIRDEMAWRKATTTKGTTISSQPLAFVLGSPLNVALLVVKPFLHWMLGLGLIRDLDVSPTKFMISMGMFRFQIINYSVALLIFSLVLTILVSLRQSGPQPAAYGHIQTLANLIDEWSPTMWWGHKYAGHAGTSNVPLGKVDMSALYG